MVKPPPAPAVCLLVTNREQVLLSKYLMSERIYALSSHPPGQVGPEKQPSPWDLMGSFPLGRGGGEWGLYFIYTTKESAASHRWHSMGDRNLLVPAN